MNIHDYPAMRQCAINLLPGESFVAKNYSYATDDIQAALDHLTHSFPAFKWSVTRNDDGNHVVTRIEANRG